MTPRNPNHHDDLPDDLPDDDQPVGRILSRREALALLGGTGAAFILGGNFIRTAAAQNGPTSTPIPGPDLPACVVRPELTEGPYFVANELNRMDLRRDPINDILKEGTPLLLRFRVSSVGGNTCTPLQGAQVDVWHCDALGAYSGVGGNNGEELWLRGFQITNAYGVADFLTIYPGWYPGRAVHIHFKIRVPTTDGARDEAYEFTSQLFFDDAFSMTVYEDEPYAQKGSQDVLNARDGIFSQSGGVLTLLPVANDSDILVPEDESSPEAAAASELVLAVPAGAGWMATFDVGLDLTDTAVGASDGAAGRPGNAGRPNGGGGRPR